MTQRAPARRCLLYSPRALTPVPSQMHPSSLRHLGQEPPRAWTRTFFTLPRPPGGSDSARSHRHLPNVQEKCLWLLVAVEGDRRRPVAGSVHTEGKAQMLLEREETLQSGCSSLHTKYEAEHMPRAVRAQEPRLPGLSRLPAVPVLQPPPLREPLTRAPGPSADRGQPTAPFFWALPERRVCTQ